MGKWAEAAGPRLQRKALWLALREVHKPQRKAPKGGYKLW